MDSIKVLHMYSNSPNSTTIYSKQKWSYKRGGHNSEIALDKTSP